MFPNVDQSTHPLNEGAHVIQSTVKHSSFSIRNGSPDSKADPGIWGRLPRLPRLKHREQDRHSVTEPGAMWKLVLRIMLKPKWKTQMSH